MKHRARLISTHMGRPVYRVPVEVVVNNSRGRIEDWCNPPRAFFEVIASSARDAANWAADRMGETPETEIVAWGPKGGETRRFIGFESAVFHAMVWREPAPQQLGLEL